MNGAASQGALTYPFQTASTSSHTSTSATVIPTTARAPAGRGGDTVSAGMLAFRLPPRNGTGGGRGRGVLAL